MGKVVLYFGDFTKAFLRQIEIFKIFTEDLKNDDKSQDRFVPI